VALARSWSVALVGLSAHVVEVEADLAQGLPGVAITGLPDTSLGEARDRVKAALVNSGFAFPQKRVTLGLSPAALPKRGSGFDLALACAVLAADRQVHPDAVAGVVVLGELGLDGRVRPVPGVLPAVLGAVRAGTTTVVVPQDNAAEARLVPDVDVVGVRSLTECVAWLRGDRGEQQPLPVDPPPAPAAPVADLSDVAGQVVGRTAMEIVAAGGHHALLLGTPGSGKTMCASRLPGILPPLTRSQALEVTAVHSVAGSLPASSPLVTRPPYQAPHHTATAASIVGGGSRVAVPGAASLAHHGVLFLDEAPEFSPRVLDALRQPLEEGAVTLTRVGGTASYPAAFTLVLAANPCPCGQERSDCTCPPERRRRYLARLSGPLLDRLDLHVQVPRITKAEVLADGGRGEPSAAVAQRVLAARERAAARLAGTPWHVNGQVPVAWLREHWPVDRRHTAVVERALDNGSLTARGYGRVLRLAWTIADLLADDRPGREHVEMALGYRLGEGGVDVAARRRRAS
jgi:magnesium chelatase family protein